MAAERLAALPAHFLRVTPLTPKEAAAADRREAAADRRRLNAERLKNARESRRAEKAERSRREALQQQADAARVRADVAFELSEAGAGHDEEVLWRCLAAAERNGVAEPDIAAAKARLKQLSGPREAAIAAAREIEACETAAAELLEEERVEPSKREEMQRKVAEAARVRLATVEREAKAETKKKEAESRRLQADKVARRERMALVQEAEASRRLEVEKRQREAVQKEEEAERVRTEVAYKLRGAAAGHDEAALERCLVAAKRSGVAKPDIAVAKAMLKKLSGAREAVIAAARELEAAKTAAAELRGKKRPSLSLQTGC